MYQSSFHGFKQKSNRKSNLAIKYTRHSRSNAASSNFNDVLLGGVIFPTHFFGQENPSFFDHFIWKV